MLTQCFQRWGFNTNLRRWHSAAAQSSAPHLRDNATSTWHMSADASMRANRGCIQARTFRTDLVKELPRRLVSSFSRTRAPRLARWTSAPATARQHAVESRVPIGASQLARSQVRCFWGNDAPPRAPTHTRACAGNGGHRSAWNRSRVLCRGARPLKSRPPVPFSGRRPQKSNARVPFLGKPGSPYVFVYVYGSRLRSILGDGPPWKCLPRSISGDGPPWKCFPRSTLRVAAAQKPL